MVAEAAAEAASDVGFAPLYLELDLAQRVMDSGYDVGLADMDGAAQFDVVFSHRAFVGEVECKTLSADARRTPLPSSRVLISGCYRQSNLGLEACGSLDKLSPASSGTVDRVGWSDTINTKMEKRLSMGLAPSLRIKIQALCGLRRNAGWRDKICCTASSRCSQSADGRSPRRRLCVSNR
jgi:hypothetical protein